MITVNTKEKITTYFVFYLCWFIKQFCALIVWITMWPFMLICDWADGKYEKYKLYISIIKRVEETNKSKS